MVNYTRKYKLEGSIDDERQLEAAIPHKFLGNIICWDLKNNRTVEFSELFYV